VKQKAKKFQREKRQKKENQQNSEALDDEDVRIVAFLLWVLDQHKKKLH
jgi:hypothetical protein